MSLFNKKEKIARDSLTSNRELIILAEDREWGVRAFVAENENTPEDALEKLAEDEDDIVRTEVARRIKVQKKILKKLAADKVKYIRVLVLNNPNSDDEIIEIVKNTDALYRLLK